jgi:Cys-rich repeat protein
MRTYQLFFALVPFAITLAGCPVWMGENEPPGEPLECRHDADCGPGALCDRGTCVVAPECAVDADCVPSELCSDASCVPRPACAGDDECPSDQFCTDGLYCADIIACAGDDTCPAGMWCGLDGLCARPAPGACRADVDCGGAELCIEDFCRDPADVCQFDYQCGLSAGGDARACVNNGCDAHCDVDADCQSSGTSCLGGYCVPDRAECASDDQCAAGEACFLGRCLASCAETGACALIDDACGADGLCRPTWEPTPLCHSSEDCQVGSECVDGVCRAPCPAAPLSCLNVDVQLTHCNQTSGYCEAEVERTPECFSAVDCGSGERCVNAICRNL